VFLYAACQQIETLEQKLQSGNVPSVFYTIPTFHNPTGAVLSSEKCRKLVHLAQKYDFHIVSDEPYNLLDLNDSAPAPSQKFPSLSSFDVKKTGRVISLGSFSKILAPGLRLGWAHSSPETIRKIATSGVFRSGGGCNPLTAGIVHSGKWDSSSIRSGAVLNLTCCVCLCLLYGSTRTWALEASYSAFATGVCRAQESSFRCSARILS
jgi:hypothetical protein